MAQDVKIRWLGHAGFQITSPNDKIIFIDPWIQGNPLCPITLDDISAARILLVTHDHFDHSSNATAIAQKTGATVVAIPETIAKLRSQGLPGENVVLGMGMNIGGTVNIDGIDVTMVQAFHSSESGNPAGFIIKLENGVTLYHAGDTGIFSTMELLGKIFKIDVAMLPIGSVFTMDSKMATEAVKLIKPKKVIPMHYKTFPILEQDAKNFAAFVAREVPGVDVLALEPGEVGTV
ncbi:MAG: metal-dependent hydrolase [Thermodesulfobacteriota bacterium]|nr:metal-dependent hydrolase [Thermodesulfobacteriota bacterium]